VATKFVNQMSLSNGIKPPKTGAVTYRVKHCPGLYLRVSHTGAASWRVMYRVGGKQLAEVLGRLRDLPRVEDAVKRARASQDAARSGRDPVAERRGAVAKADANTVAAAFERYLAEHVERNLRPGTIRNYEQAFRHDILPKWGDRPLAEISKADILLIVNNKASKRERPRKGKTGGAVVAANHVLARLRSFFAWCVSNDLVANDPTKGVLKVAKERPRDRVLTDDEIRLFWAATGDGGPWSVLFRTLLLTAQRRSEVAGMRWKEIDIENRVWELPSSRSKNNKSHIVHLSALAMAQLQGLPRERDRLFAPGSFSRAKARLDAAMGVSDWVTHDLRRSATTLMAAIGIAPHVADRILNHQSGVIRGIASVYNRFQYIDERRDALERLGEHIARLVGENVVGLPRRA
jgi:integrase